MHRFLVQVGLTACLAILAMGGALLTAGCSESFDPTSPAGNEIVIFIDFSESVRGANQSLFEDALMKSIVPSLAAGDRITIAPINDKTLTRFHPLVEATFPDKPNFNGWMDNVLKHNQRVKAVEEKVGSLRAEIGGQVDHMFTERRRSRQTDIFSSLLMAQKLFDHEPTRKVLVLMSDMIVDYPPYRFDRISWSDEKNEELLGELQAKGMIPNLSGVCVYVSGVSAESAEAVSHISKFWLAYFERANADMDPSRYAHVLLHWPPSKSCSS